MIELHYYDKLSRAYMNAGNPTKMVAYHKRVFYGLLEPEDSFVRQASQAVLKAKKVTPTSLYSRPFTLKCDGVLKGLNVVDVDKMPWDFSA